MASLLRPRGFARLACCSPRTPPRRTAQNLGRTFGMTAARAARQAKRDDLMDKDSLDTTSTENSQSGGDSAAAHEADAFDPKTTKPEEEGGKSLDVSPGNPSVSKPSEDADEGTAESPSQAKGKRGVSSGTSSAKKNGS